MIKSGNKYFCSWGPACERAHDIYDETLIEIEVKENRRKHVMTTWHQDESLSEALWYLLFQPESKKSRVQNVHPS